MIPQNVRQLLAEATADLNLMSNESERFGGGNPEFMICWALKNCVSKFLISYLMANSVDTNEMHSISDLIQLCLVRDKEFERIDIEQLTCRGANITEFSSCYCSEQGHMKNCIDEAKKVKEIIYRKLELAVV